MENTRPNEQRAKSAILWIWIVLALEIANLISSYMQYDLLQAIIGGGYVSDEATNANDIREGLLGMLYFAASIVSCVTFIKWFRRAYFNLHRKVGGLTYSEGWAAGSWFVPIISLYRPYKIMKEIYVKTREFLTQKGLSERIDYSTAYLGWWWALWVISAVVGQFVIRMTLQGEDTVDNLVTITIMQIILGIIGIPLAIITVKIIKDYSKAEPLLAQIKDEEQEINNGEE